MYTIAQYGEMIRDSVRTGAYAAALRRHVTSESVVLDIGCGTGIFALLACQYGARHVYAIEPDDSIEVARAIAEDNGYGDRITFYQALSTQVELPEPAEVIVADLHGVLPLYQGIVPTIVDARRRLMAPGGVWIPRRDKLYVAPVEAEDAYQRLEEPWRVNPFGLNMVAARQIVSNNWWLERIRPEQLMAPGQSWYELDYTTVTEPNAEAVVTFEASRDGRTHGIVMWFDCDLTEGVSFSGAPGQPELVFGHAFFPFAEPLDLVAGDRLTVRIAADLVGDDYVWRWETDAKSAAECGRAKASYRQSTAFGRPLSLARLHKAEAGYRPRLNTAGKVDRMILERMDGRTSLAEIAARVQAEYPAEFADEAAALKRVAKLSIQYG